MMQSHVFGAATLTFGAGTLTPYTRCHWSRAGGLWHARYHGDVAAVRRSRGWPSTARRARAVLYAPVSIGARGQAGRTRGRSEGGRVGTDGVDEDEMVAGGAGVGAGEVEREEGGEPAEGQGWVRVVRGAEGEGVVGAAVGAGGARVWVKHGGSLCASTQASAGAACGATGTTGIVNDGGCWGDYSR